MFLSKMVQFRLLPRLSLSRSISQIHQRVEELPSCTSPIGSILPSRRFIEVSGRLKVLLDLRVQLRVSSTPEARTRLQSPADGGTGKTHMSQCLSASGFRCPC